MSHARAVAYLKRICQMLIISRQTRKSNRLLSYMSCAGVNMGGCWMCINQYSQRNNLLLSDIPNGTNNVAKVLLFSVGNIMDQSQDCSFRIYLCLHSLLILPVARK